MPQVSGHTVPSASLGPEQVLSARYGADSSWRMRYTDVPDTLELMAAYARRDRVADTIREAANTTTIGVDVQNAHEVAASIWRYIRNRVRWIPDANGVELLQTPIVTLRQRYGDCDDQATLAAAMLAALGIPAGFEAIAYRQKGVFDHVYALYWDGVGWHMLDPTAEARPGPGTMRPAAHDRMTFFLHQQDTRAPDAPEPMQTLTAGTSGLAVYNRNTPYAGYNTNAPATSPAYDLSGLGQTDDTNITTTGSEGGTWQDILYSLLAVGPEYIRALRSDGTVSGDGSTLTQEERARLLYQQQQQQAGFLSGTTGILVLTGGLLAAALTLGYFLFD